MKDFDIQLFETNHELIRSRFDEIKTLERLDAIQDLKLKHVHKSGWNPMTVIYDAKIKSPGAYKNLGGILNNCSILLKFKGYKNLGKRNEYRVFQGNVKADNEPESIDVTLRAYKPIL